MSGISLQGKSIRAGDNEWRVAVTNVLYLGSYTRYDLKISGPKTYSLTIRMEETPADHQETRILAAIARHLERIPAADAGDIWL